VLGDRPACLCDANAVSAVSERKRHARSLFAGIAPDYDRWAQLLSFGQDRRWHDVMVETVAPAADRDGALVADVATGTGAVAIALARRYPCRVVGIDQSPDMLAGARERIAAAGLAERIELLESDAEGLPLAPASVDALTHTYLLRYVDDPAAVLRTLAAAVRPGGIMASLEFGVPRGAALHAWRAYTRIGLPVAGALAGPGWVHTGRFLGPSIERFWNRHPLESVLGMWADAGMQRVRARRLSTGGGVVISGVRGG
jgi:demethylmenaquinone methyltransferase / 2-methoxy-6-polyprenyl-1,4-benzoquinol methylase